MIPSNPFAGKRGGQLLLPCFQNLPQNIPLLRPTLDHLAQAEAWLPQFVRNCRTAMRYLALLGPLDWAHFPE